MDAKITDINDWSPLLNEKLTVVPDPMVIRAAELFLKGPKGAASAETTWEFLSKNIHALGMFFDMLILEERIPLFDYADTFDMGLTFNSSVLGRANDDVKTRILWDVHVDYPVYMQVKMAALSELRKLYDGPAKIQQSLATDIIEELALSEYQWQPHLGDLESLPTPAEKTLARFFLGGLIFGGYAQMLGGEHVIQPKRSRLMVAAALHSPSGNHKFEDELFAELRKRASTAVADVPWRPSFFPYLLSVANTPSAVLAEAKRLRESSETLDYRAWLKDALVMWQRDGRLNSQKKDIREIAAAIDRRIEKAWPDMKVEMKVTAVEVGLGVDLTPTLQAMWGWILSSLPGKRYRKLLTRAVADDGAYVNFENRVSTVWRNAA